MKRLKNLISLADAAIKKYSKETKQIEFLAENRYNRKFFPTTGQYDWFSGQLLYCLIRYTKPKQIIEICTSSGYSTMFMALALKKNGLGKIYTFDMDEIALNAAKRNFRKYKVSKFIKTYLGDAMKEIEKVKNIGKTDLCFLDAEHTEEFARWFIEKIVMETRNITLFTMHDILPTYARVRKYNGPPWPITNLHFYRTLAYRLLCKFKGIDLGRKNIKFNIKKPKGKKGLWVYDGIEGSEAVFGNKLAYYMKKRDYFYCHDLANRFQKILESRKYDSLARGFQNEEGKPYEWNHSLWAYAEAIKNAYKKLSDSP